MFLLFCSHVSTQIGHHRVICEEYTNDRIYIKTTLLVQNFS
jgi:hypothetical protein